MGAAAAGSDNSLQVNVSSLLGSCAADVKALGCNATCSPTCQPGGNLAACFACDRGATLGTIDEQLVPDRFRPNQEKYCEVSSVSHVRPLIEPGDLVRVRRRSAGPKVALVNNEYELDSKPLGRGTYGEVFVGCHRQTGVRRAIKKIEKECLRRYVENVPDFIKREIDCLRRLDHPNIIRIYETYETDESTDLVLELCEGGDLLDRLRLSQPRFPEQEAASIFGQMLGAIQHLHLRGVVHRDIKPENFLFKHREKEREPLPPAIAPIKLIDFGLSRRVAKNGYACMTPKIGTAEYMAPETFAGQLNAAHAHSADMWSIGVILHVIFLGYFPSPKLLELPSEVYFANTCFSDVSREGIDLISCLLRKDPRQRPPVNKVLKHPWLRAAVRLENEQIPLVIPAAMRAWTKSGRLRRLALVAVAREIDDRDSFDLRNIFQMLELECNGAITRSSLEHLSRGHGNLALSALALYTSFYQLDIDGSDAIDWSELLAAVLSIRGKLSESMQSSTLSSGGWQEHTADNQEHHLEEFIASLPTATDLSCKVAFDLFSQGSGAVTGVTLRQLLAHVDGTFAPNKGEMPQTSTLDAHQIDSLVNEVSPIGLLKIDDFVSLVRSDNSVSSLEQSHSADDLSETPSQKLAM